MNFGTRLHCVAISSAMLLVPPFAIGGERTGVLQTLEGLPSSWADAHPMVEIQGSGSKELTLGERVKFAYRTSQPSYVAFVHVTSHGEMTLMKAHDSQTGAIAEGATDSFTVTPPLGTETIFFLFSKQPLEGLFTGGQASRSVGDRASDAAALVQQVRSLSNGASLAIKRIEYQIVGRPEQTQYTTRGIIREMAVASASSPSLERPAVASFPTRIQFEFNSDKILPPGRLALDVFGELLARSEAKSLPLKLEGHTDDIGSDDYNAELSVRRARSAKEYLVASFGIDPARISVAGFGKSRPLTPNVDEASRAQNRRVDFILPAVVLKDDRH